MSNIEQGISNVKGGEFLVFSVGFGGVSPAGEGKLKIKMKNAKLWIRFAGFIFNGGCSRKLVLAEAAMASSHVARPS